MRRISVSIVAAIGLSFGLGHMASAADISGKAPIYKAPPAVPAYNWTGFYIGGHAGAAWQSAPSWTFFDTNPVPFDPKTLTSTTRFGAAGGLQGGYSWQFAPTWLLGIEGDISWTSLSDHRAMGPLTFLGFAQQAATGVSMSTSTNWLASVRGRLGFIAWNNTLLFVTGGGALANTDYNAHNTLNNGFVSNFSSTTTKAGWVIGGGAEWMATSNILIRAEYLYYSFNNNVTAASLCQPFAGCFEPNAFINTWNKYNIQVARMAISYKF